MNMHTATKVREALTYLIFAEDRDNAGQGFVAIDLRDKAISGLAELLAQHDGVTPHTVRMRIEAVVSRMVYARRHVGPTVCTTGEVRP